MHSAACTEESGSSSSEAREALHVTLQCAHALMSGAAGMLGVLAVPGFVPRICSMLAQPDAEATKLAVEMLIKLCLYSMRGYRLAIQVLAPPHKCTINQRHAWHHCLTQSPSISS